MITHEHNDGDGDGKRQTGEHGGVDVAQQTVALPALGARHENANDRVHKQWVSDNLLVIERHHLSGKAGFCPRDNCYNPASLNELTRLDEYSEGPAQMVRVREGLELADLLGGQLLKRTLLVRLFQNADQELWLGAEDIGLETDRFAGSLDGGEIDVGGEVLFAGTREQIVTDAMPMIGAHGAAGASGRKYFFIGEAIINGEQFAMRQRLSGGAPPAFGGGRGFDGVIVRQHVQEFGRKLERGREAGFGDLRPDQFVAFDGDRPFEPAFLLCIPAEAMHRKSVEQFIAENDSGETGILSGQVLEVGEPTGVLIEPSQSFLLPGLPSWRRFQDAIFDLFEQNRVMKQQPVQDISGEFAIMRAGFDDLQSGTVHFWRFQPFCKLDGQQFAEEISDTDAGDEIATAADSVLLRFIIPSFRTVKSEVHEAGKRNKAFAQNFFADSVGGHFHCLQAPMALISVAANERIYGQN